MFYYKSHRTLPVPHSRYHVCPECNTTWKGHGWPKELRLYCSMKCLQWSSSKVRR